MATPFQTTQPGSNGERWFARLKYFAWIIATKSLLTLIYLVLISQGIRYFLPELAKKLYKLPGLGFLQDYSATYRLDMAHAIAAIPLALAWVAWHLNIELFLRPEVFAHRFQNWNLKLLRIVIPVLGAIVVTADALLFLAAFSLNTWGGMRLSLSAVLATLVYVVILGGVTLTSIILKESLDNFKNQM